MKKTKTKKNKASVKKSIFAMLVITLMIFTVSVLPVVNSETIKKEQINLIDNKIKELKNLKLGTEYRYDDFIDILKTIALTIAEILIILFGNNIIGLMIALFFTGLLMSIPVFILSCVASIEVFTMDFMNNLDITSISDILESFGIFGMIFFIIFGLPILLLLGLFSIPVGAVFFFPFIMTEIIDYVTGEIQG